MDQQTVVGKTRALPGRASLFRGKIRMPVSLTLTPDHHAKVRRNMQRLGLSRSDFIGLLIEKHADTVRILMDATATRSDSGTATIANDEHVLTAEGLTPLAEPMVPARS